MKKITTTHPSWNKDQTYEVTVEAGKSIQVKRIFRDYRGGVEETVSPEFRVGDYAVYGSYNLIYTGRIVSITEKTVTIKPYENQDGTKRLKHADFAWRNYDYNAERIASRNHETSMCI